jgi:very-short-patch-repair endonuclease
LRVPDVPVDGHRRAVVGWSTLRLMRVDEVLERLGGVSDSRTLQRATSARRIRTALRRGDIVRAGYRGYALPTADAGAKAAVRLRGAASHLSAAALYGWELKLKPERPAVIVPRNRKVDRARRAGVDVRWRGLEFEELRGGITGKVRTVIDCARDLPFDVALAVADSALRRGDVTQDELIRAAELLPTTGRARALLVARQASGKAANPFESVLRAIALDAGLRLEPQVEINDRGFACRPDLVEPARRWVVEADSFEFHASRRALARDCRRYTALGIRGWVVLSFSWEDVMFHPDYVRESLLVLAGGPLERATLPGRVSEVA